MWATHAYRGGASHDANMHYRNRNAPCTQQQQQQQHMSMQPARQPTHLPTSARQNRTASRCLAAAGKAAAKAPRAAAAASPYESNCASHSGGSSDLSRGAMPRPTAAASAEVTWQASARTARLPSITSRLNR